MQLVEVKSGSLVRVVGFDATTSLENKLRQLGLMPGDQARVLRQAPFGGPLLIEVGGRSLALGRRIAARVLVEEIACD